MINEYLDLYGIDHFKDWPGNFPPDINSIENLWGIVKGQLHGQDMSSLTRLEKAICFVWINLNPEIPQNLALSIPDWLKAVLKAKGGPNRY